jgi:hypothetical protein
MTVDKKFVCHRAQLSNRARSGKILLYDRARAKRITREAESRYEREPARGIAKANGLIATNAWPSGGADTDGGDDVGSYQRRTGDH